MVSNPLAVKCRYIRVSDFPFFLILLRILFPFTKELETLRVSLQNLEK